MAIQLKQYIETMPIMQRLVTGGDHNDCTKLCCSQIWNYIMNFIHSKPGRQASTYAPGIQADNEMIGQSAACLRQAYFWR